MQFSNDSVQNVYDVEQTLSPSSEKLQSKTQQSPKPAGPPGDFPDGGFVGWSTVAGA